MASSDVTTLFLPLMLVLMDLELPGYSSLLLLVRLMYVVFSTWYISIIRKEFVQENEQGRK